MKKQPYLAPEVSLLVVSTENFICSSFTKSGQVWYDNGGEDDEFDN